MARQFQRYRHKDANFRYVSEFGDELIRRIKEERAALERFLSAQAGFAASLEPVPCPENAPRSVKLMCAAADKTGVGPMAAVAGTMAYLSAEEAIDLGDRDVIVENGGDIYLASERDIILGIYAGSHPIGDRLAFRITPENMPLAVCSSSSKMGHSLSFGNCDLVTVFSADAALADAAATAACNLIRRERDIAPVLERYQSIDGILGIFAAAGKQTGLSGNLPEIIKADDNGLIDKVTRDYRSGFQLRVL